MVHTGLVGWAARRQRGIKRPGRLFSSGLVVNLSPQAHSSGRKVARRVSPAFTWHNGAGRPPRCSKNDLGHFLEWNSHPSHRVSIVPPGAREEGRCNHWPSSLLREQEPPIHLCVNVIDFKRLERTSWRRASSSVVSFPIASLQIKRAVRRIRKRLPACYNGSA